MLYVKEDPNVNGTHDNFRTDYDFSLDGWLAVPPELEETALLLLPFISITTDNGVITAVEDNAEARERAAAPTLDELRAAALARIDGKCSASIESGVTVDGVLYPLKQGTAQAALDAAVKQANSGETEIPYGPYGQAYTLYTPAQIYAVNKAAYQWGIVNMTYYALLKTWIAREKDAAALAGIDYGSALPEDLTTALTAQLTAAGIDAAVLSGIVKE